MNWLKKQNKQTVDTEVSITNPKQLFGVLYRVLTRAGAEVVERALWLYYAADRPETPAWAKTTIYGALAYLILPLDAHPDLIPLTGYTDDLGVLLAAIATVTSYIDDEVKQKAAEKLRNLKLRNISD